MGEATAFDERLVEFFGEGVEFRMFHPFDEDSEAFVEGDACVEEERELFGGDAVLGENESSADCPTFDDPIRTLNVDGSEIPAGVLVGVREHLWLYVAVILVSVVGMFALLVGLIVWRRSLAGARRALARK